MLVVTAAYQAGRYTSWILTVQGTLGASAVETHNILDATPKPHRQHRQREPSGILSRQPFRAAATIHLPHSVSNAVGNVAQGGKGITWPDITIISFTNMGMMDFALSWLHHLHIAIGKEEVAARLLMFVVGDEARKVLVQSGLCPERCIRRDPPLALLTCLLFPLHPSVLVFPSGTSS